MKTEIYVQARTKNPAKQKEAQAKWHIRCVLGNGAEETRDGTVVLKDATTKRAVLTALLEALNKFNKAAVIRIYISDDYVRACLINGWLGKWKANEWHKIRLNGEVMHLDLWQQISQQLSKHAVTFAHGEELDNKTLKEMEWRMNNVKK
jgi:ribonuclease HI